MTDQNNTNEDLYGGFGSFIDKLIEEKGYPEVEPEVMAQLKQDIMVRLDNFIAARVVSALSDEDVTTFQKMLEDKKPWEEIQKFTVDHISNYEDFLTNTLMEFRAVYLGLLDVPEVDDEIRGEPQDEIESDDDTKAGGLSEIAGEDAGEDDEIEYPEPAPIKH